MRHTLIALAMQIALAPFAGWWAGAAFACAFFLGREIAQAEHRGIQAFYGRRVNAPWWVGLEPRAWTAKGLLDFILPTVAVCVAALVMGGR